MVVCCEFLLNWLLRCLVLSDYACFSCTPTACGMAGTYDRWAEAIIENSYGTLSLLADPVVLPTLYMPKGSTSGQNAFAYSEAPVNDYLQSLGHDRDSDFHTILVCVGNRVNEQYTGWQCIEHREVWCHCDVFSQKACCPAHQWI